MRVLSSVSRLCQLQAFFPYSSGMPHQSGQAWPRSTADNTVRGIQDNKADSGRLGSDGDDRGTADCACSLHTG